MVKELLFDKFIYMLSEPKKISKKKLSITNLITDNNVIDTISNNIGNIIVDIKIAKKNNVEFLDTKCKIIKDKKNIWSYTNNTSIDKKKETINTIIYIIDYFDTNNINGIINIKLNNKQFIKDFKKAIYNYNEFVKYEENDDNLVQNAMENNTNDLGIMSYSISIGEFQKLIEKKDRFKFID